MRFVMDKIICLECNKDFKNDISLHKHFRTHKMRVAQYYQKYFPRYDKYDNSLIRFKSKEFYFNNDFNSRNNLKLWLDNVTKDEAKAYIRDYLLRRKRNKNIVYAPCQIELKTLPLPGMVYLNGLFGDYYAFCESLGFRLKYKQKDVSIKPRALKKNKIIVDSREQKPLEFNLKTKVDGLKFGDYKLDDDTITCKCYIERKSIPDFYGTFSSGFDRFKREVARAEEAEANLIIIVEGNLQEVANFPKLLQTYCKTSISPEYVYHNMRELIQANSHIQFIFVNGRDEAVRVIEKIFASECKYKEIDLQYAYDIKEL